MQWEKAPLIYSNTSSLESRWVELLGMCKIRSTWQIVLRKNRKWKLRSCPRTCVCSGHLWSRVSCVGVCVSGNRPTTLPRGTFSNHAVFLRMTCICLERRQGQAFEFDCTWYVHDMFIRPRIGVRLWCLENPMESWRWSWPFCAYDQVFEHSWVFMGWVPAGITF